MTVAMACPADVVAGSSPTEESASWVTTASLRVVAMMTGITVPTVETSDVVELDTTEDPVAADGVVRDGSVVAVVLEDVVLLDDDTGIGCGTFFCPVLLGTFCTPFALFAIG